MLDQPDRAPSPSREIRRRALFALGADLFGREQLLCGQRQLLGRGVEPLRDLLDALSRVLGDVAPQLRCQRLELLGRALLPFGAGTAPRTAHRTRGSTRGTPRRGRAAPQQRGFDGTPLLFGDRGSKVLDETIDNGTNGLIVPAAREAIMFAKAWSACFRLLSTGVRHSVRSRR